MIFAIWKLRGPTSHDVVDVIRRITRVRRVGHAGTLDPMAEGVLAVGIGREATKQLASIVAKEKEYVATIALGATSTTDDAEGEITPSPTFFPSHRDGSPPARAVLPLPEGEREGVGAGARGGGSGEHEGVGLSEIEHTLRKFLGRIEQVPPTYSAVKVRGKPAHRRVRKGEKIELKPRIVEIKEIELLKYAPPPTPPLKEGEGLGGILTLRVICGPGTYIRALARDIGHALGVGGYLTALTRTRVGTYTKANALTIEQFRERWPQVAGGR